jgi:hypothetical protein
MQGNAVDESFHSYTQAQISLSVFALVESNQEG